MLLLSRLTLQHDWKKAAVKKMSPRRQSPVPRYEGRWPFIMDAGNAQERAGDEIGAAHVAQEARRILKPEATAEIARSAANDVTQAARDQYDHLLTAVRRTPLQAVVIAAGVGFVAALLGAERRTE